MTAEAKVPFVVMNAAGTTTTRPRPISAPLHAVAIGLSARRVGRKKGMKKAYTLVSDFVPGYESEEAFTKGFTQAGGEIVGKRAGARDESRFRALRPADQG